MKKLFLLFIPLLFISCEPNANNDVTIEETVEKQEPAQEQNTEEQNTEINNTPTIPENERVCEMKIYKIGLINPNAESEVVGEIRVSDGDFGGWEELKYTDNSYHYGFYSELSDFKVFYSGHVVEFYKIEIDTITK